MDKGSFLWLLVIAGIALLAAYNALFPLPAYYGFTRFLALSGFMLVCISLIMGPLAVISPQNFAILLAHRRAIGLASFAFIVAHFAVSLLFQYGMDLWLAISSSTYMPLAAVALVIFALLTVTSTDWAVKSLKNWKDIQRLAYIAFVFSFVHFITRSNGLLLNLGQVTFVNVAEVAMVLLGIATIVLQAYGYFTVKGRQQKAQQAAQNPPAQTQQPGQEAGK